MNLEYKTRYYLKNKEMIVSIMKNTNKYIRCFECLISWFAALTLAENSNKVIVIKERIIKYIKKLSKTNLLHINGYKKLMETIRNIEVGSLGKKAQNKNLKIHKLNFKSKSKTIQKLYNSNINRKKNKNLNYTYSIKLVINIYEDLLEIFDKKGINDIIVTKKLSKKTQALEYEIGRSMISKNKDNKSILNIVINSIKKELREKRKYINNIEDQSSLNKTILSYTIDSMNYSILEKFKTIRVNEEKYRKEKEKSLIGEITKIIL